ncbi:MAG: DUF1360 domain-containing protein [Candidatus Nanoarchaeia archaeon]
MKIDEKYYIWNYVFTVSFVVILIGFILINRISIQNSMPPSLLIIVLMALATQRLTRFIMKDKIVQSIRDGIKRKSATNSFFYTINELIVCSWCTSMWAALFIIIVYYSFPLLSIPLLIVLSISSIASIIQALLSKI